MRMFKTRNDFVKSLSNNLIICEIGVFTGDFSKILFDTNPKELHLIDPFEGNFSSGDKDGYNIKNVNLTQYYKTLVNCYRENENVYVYKKYSTEALPLFPDEYFDFMYIDANHDYKYVQEDLELCKRKTKRGGIIAGHDYSKSLYIGVVNAVEDFCKKYGFEIDYMTEDRCATYGIIKK